MISLIFVRKIRGNNRYNQPTTDGVLPFIECVVLNYIKGGWANSMMEFAIKEMKYRLRRGFFALLKGTSRMTRINADLYFNGLEHHIADVGNMTPPPPHPLQSLCRPRRRSWIKTLVAYDDGRLWRCFVGQSRLQKQMWYAVSVPRMA